MAGAYQPACLPTGAAPCERLPDYTPVKITE